MKMPVKGMLIEILALITVAYVDGDENSVRVRYLHIKSDIQSRFVTSLITSRLTNPSSEAKEISFTAQLPDAAFISNFSMQTGDKIIVGDVKEKEQAKIAYDAARRRGESAGLVAQKPRETNTFTISTNIAAHDKVTFNLTYQEILKRVHGAYKHVINLQSDKLQKISDIKISVRIVEQGKILNVSIPKFGSKIGEKTNSELLTADQESNAQITTVTAGTTSTTQITYKPRTDKIETANGTLAGQLVVLYDVERNSGGGDIQVVNGYFVHFFAPNGLQKINKHVIFVLDKSGSMIGTKFMQTKRAMHRILADLDQHDLFNIIMFHSHYNRWKPESVRATPNNILEATTYVNKSVADLMTNIYDPLADALNILRTSETSSVVPMIIFMTDGQPNSGTISRPDDILRSVTEFNKNTKVSIHSIAFGNDADFNLVQRISANNFGLARKVYEDLDADLQLTGFYAEISSPLLTNVKIEYLNETVDVSSLVQDQTNNYYDGGELVTFGKLADNAPELVTFDSKINARGASGQISLSSTANTFICSRPIITEDDTMEPCCLYPKCPRLPRLMPVPVTTTERSLPGPTTVGGFVERMWAYQTIKKLLKDAELEAGNSTEKRQQALRLSLKYHFVTEMTSMVVVQTDSENATALEKIAHDQRNQAGDPVYRSRSYNRGHFVRSGSGRLSVARPVYPYQISRTPQGHHILDPDYEDEPAIGGGSSGVSGHPGPPSPFTHIATTTPTPPRSCIAEILVVVDPTAAASSISSTRVNRMINAITNSGARWNLKIYGVRTAPGNTSNQSAIFYEKSFNGPFQNGNQLQADVDDAFNAINRRVAATLTIEDRAKNVTVTGPRLMFWVGHETEVIQSHSRSVDSLIRYLATRKGSAFVSGNDTEFETWFTKIQSENFQKICR